MRYSTSLHFSTKNHILKNRRLSALISLFGFALIFAILLAVVNLTELNAHQLFFGFIFSLFRISVAYIFALVIALVLAFLITAHKKVENILLPVFDVLQSFPSFALFPVLVEVLAHSPEIIIILVLSLSMVWEILFTLIGGIKNRREDLEEAATVFGARGFKRLYYFTIPALLPSIVTGSIIGWGEGWEFIIGAELLVHVHYGIGNYLGFLGSNHQDTLLAFGILFLMLVLFILNKLIWLPLLYKTSHYSSES